MNDNTLRWIIARVIDNAKDLFKNSENNENEDFLDGRKLANY